MRHCPLFAFALVLAPLALVTAAPASASAQRALAQVLDLNRQGMEAYNNLEIEQAQQLLLQALQAAQRGGVTGSPLARTYLNLGVVAIGGMGDNGAGLDYMVRALQADPNVQLDPLTSTPDIQTVFALAVQRVRAGGGRTSAGSGTTSGTGTASTPSTGTGPASSTGSTSATVAGTPAGDLQHVPVPEQLQQTAVPVYIEVPGAPAHVYIYYRGHGMREFRREEMQRVGRGYGFEIPCEDVFSPELSYYIVAFGRDGSPIGFAGSQSAPVRVPIVTARTQSAPALPGRAPPEQCRDDECPPGMAGCSHGGAGSSRRGATGRGLGEACSRDSDCASNHCEDDLCAPSRGGDGGSSEGGASAGPQFFARLGAMAGLSYVGPGLVADRVPCAEGERTDDFPCFEVPGLPTVPSGWDDPSFDREGSDHYAIALANGYVPPGTATCFPNDANLFGPDPEPYCFYVETPGLVANFGLRLDVGYYVASFLAITAGARLQPMSGRGTLSFLQIYGGLEVQFTPPTDVGFHVHAHLRGGAGQIQVFLGRGANTPNAPWGTSGIGMIDFGVTAGYRFMRNVGLYLQPTAVFGFPAFLFTLDVGGGVEVGF